MNKLHELVKKWRSIAAELDGRLHHLPEGAMMECADELEAALAMYDDNLAVITAQRDRLVENLTSLSYRWEKYYSNPDLQSVCEELAVELRQALAAVKGEEFESCNLCVDLPTCLAHKRCHKLSAAVKGGSDE